MNPIKLFNTLYYDHYFDRDRGLIVDELDNRKQALMWINIPFKGVGDEDRKRILSVLCSRNITSSKEMTEIEYLSFRGTAYDHENRVRHEFREWILGQIKNQEGDVP